jgi:hypothetical protein
MIKLFMVTVFFLMVYFIYNLTTLPTLLDNVKPLKTSEPAKESAKVCMLVSMYIGDNRREMYTKNIKHWLNDTNLDIYTVDSSGKYLDIKHPRLFQYSFKQDSAFIRYNVSVSEKVSIEKALAYFDLSAYDLIFKVTGKYFLPEFESFVKYIPKDTSLILQSRMDHARFQNTELVGFRKEHFPIISNEITDTFGFEHSLYSAVEKGNFTTYRLPELNILYKTKRGDGWLLEYL